MVGLASCEWLNRAYRYVQSPVRDPDNSECIEIPDLGPGGAPWNRGYTYL